MNKIFSEFAPWMMTVKDLKDELSKHPDDAPVGVFCGVEDDGVMYFEDGVVIKKRFVFKHNNQICYDKNVEGLREVLVLS